MLINFGKHTGWQISDLPTDYLLWVTTIKHSKSPEQQTELIKEIEFRALSGTLERTLSNRFDVRKQKGEVK